MQRVAEWPWASASTQLVGGASSYKLSNRPSAMATPLIILIGKAQVGQLWLYEFS